MKFLLVLCAVVACAVALPSDAKEEHRKKAKEIVKACIDETGATEENAEKMRNGDFSIRDEKTQCFVDCFFRKIGFVNDNGDYLPDAIIEKIRQKHEVKSEVNIEDLVNGCVKEKGENKCETSFKVYECYRSKVEYKKCDKTEKAH